MNQRDRHEHALQVFHQAHTAFGEHPNAKEEHTINAALIPWLAWPATSAQITEALATIATIHLRRTHQPGLTYQGQDVLPCDTHYEDALAEYEEEDETTLYRIIQEIENNGKE